MHLPWPPSALRPNASSPGNWRAKSEAAKKYRGVCLMMAKSARLRPLDGPMALRIDFHPPDNRRRDLDNMLASFKQGIDAVAETMGVDDSIFALRLSKRAPVKHGSVIVLVEAV